MILLCSSGAGYCAGWTHTALRRIAMLPWKTVGQHDPSSSSAATCTWREEECKGPAVTKQAQTISSTTSFSSAPLRNYVVNLRTHGRCWGGQALWTIPDTVSLCSTCREPGWQIPPDALLFWMLTLLWQSLTSTARTSIHVSRLVVQTQLLSMAGMAATSMRLTRGCGSLDVASLAWEAWQLRRLLIGRMLSAKYVSRTYQYALCLQNIAEDAVSCHMPVGNNTVCAWHVCNGAPTLNQCPYWCPTYMTLFRYILVLVCTCLYYNIIPVLVCTKYVLVHTCTY